jgi:carbamoyltransferase
VTALLGEGPKSLNNTITCKVTAYDKYDSASSAIASIQVFPPDASGLQAALGNLLENAFSSSDANAVSQILRDKNIVALFQGSSEIGPRALGNRSIIFDPTFKDGKDFVNNVKRREYFRPFAGSILHEHVNEWFDMRGLEESPNMMYAVNCQPGVEEKIPSIIHIDGTCRIQTVKPQQNPLFYELISEFYKLTGVPILFNTSFNLGGAPMVETLHDAIHTLVNSDIEYLYLPEYKILITAENQQGKF